MIKNTYPGKYIMGEGEDGSGKTTQMRLLEEKFKAEGQKALYVKEPSRDNVFGRLAYAIYSFESVRGRTNMSVSECLSAPEFVIMKNEVTGEGSKRISHFETIAHDFMSGKSGDLPKLLQLSMIFARRELIRSQVIPALKAGTHVVSDRGFFSTLCYGKSEGLDWRELWQLHADLLGDYFLVPDLTFIFDVPIEEALRRKLIQQSGRQDRFDQVEIMASIRAAYLELIDESERNLKMNILKIDGTPSESEIHASLWKSVSKLIAV